ncbi:MAG TPA: hypothetical protein VFV73_01175 [Streptosporangiaceae bacterium]|nr:hypothetical protein [Streptosporangiaceae bacterium]
MLHQFGEPVGADVRPGRATGHRDLERLDRARWFPPRCAGLACRARQWLLGGVPDRAACAEGVVQVRGCGLCPDRTLDRYDGS